jgi:hypothetical protein
LGIPGDALIPAHKSASGKHLRDSIESYTEDKGNSSVPVAEGYLGGGGKHEQQNLALLE